MQSKALRYSIAGLVCLVLMAGSFTGGLAAGWFIPVRPADVTDRLTGRSTVEPPTVVTTPSAAVPDPTETGSVPSTELNKLFPLSGRRGTSCTRSMLTSRLMI